MFNKDLFGLELGDTIRVNFRGRTKDVFVEKIEIDLESLKFKIKVEGINWRGLVKVEFIGYVFKQHESEYL